MCRHVPRLSAPFVCGRIILHFMFSAIISHPACGFYLFPLFFHFGRWQKLPARGRGPPCAPRACLSHVKTRQAPPFPHSGQRRVIRLVDAILFHFNVENPVESVENPPEKPLFGPIGAGFTQGFPHGVEKLSTKLRVEFWLSRACFDDFAGCFFVFFVHFSPYACGRGRPALY